MAKFIAVVACLWSGAVGVLGYQPYEYQGLQHHHQQQPFQQRAYEGQSTSLSEYQKQIQQWQLAVGQRASPLRPNSVGYSNEPFIDGGYYDTRNDFPRGIPPQPTIVAPIPPGSPGSAPQPVLPPVSGPSPPQPLPEIPDNQVIGTPSPQPLPPQSSDPLKALCKAPRGQFPGTSCNKFVNCWDDVVVEQDCPVGLYFNELGFCDYSFNVRCTNPPAPQPVPIGGAGGPEWPSGVGGAPGQVDLGAPGAKCPTEFGTYRSIKNCGVFYMCVGYLPFEFTCPAGLNFHKDLQVCDYPYRVECNGVPTNTVPEPVTEPVPATILPPTPAETASIPMVPPPSEPAPPPPVVPGISSINPDAFHNLKKVPAGLVDSGVPCRANTVFRLNPSCSSVAICRNGFTQVLNCGPGTSYDIYTHRCTSYLRARC